MGVVVSSPETMPTPRGFQLRHTDRSSVDLRTSLRERNYSTMSVGKPLLSAIVKEVAWRFERRTDGLQKSSILLRSPFEQARFNRNHSKVRWCTRCGIEGTPGRQKEIALLWGKRPGKLAGSERSFDSVFCERNNVSMEHAEMR